MDLAVKVVRTSGEAQNHCNDPKEDVFYARITYSGTIMARCWDLQARVHRSIKS